MLSPADSKGTIRSTLHPGWMSRLFASVLVFAITATSLHGVQSRAEAVEATQTLTFAPSDDSYTHKNNPGTNYGRAATLNVDGGPAQHVWLKFQLAGLTGPVQRARLRLFATDPSDAGGEAYRASNTAWTENTLTWNNQPAVDGARLAAQGAVAAGGWYEWDVTAAVTGDGAYTFALKSASTNGADYASSEAAANRPQLVVEFAPVDTTATPVPTLPPTASPTPTSTASGGVVRFAVIGDYGKAGQGEADVANLVKGWNPDFVITVGDNNYPNGEAATIDANIGQYYQAFIGSYQGAYGAGSPTYRFFPSLGNHDWYSAGAQPYLDYFTLPGNERYYDFTWGPVHFYALDSDPAEVDGISSTSVQGRWLQARLSASQSCWDLVYLHHAPYSSSSSHGSTASLQWPYPSWGAEAVLAGHDHTYERILKNGFPYFVNGLGGVSRYSFGTPVAGSAVRYSADYGAMLVEAAQGRITYSFITRTGSLIDTFTQTKACP